MEVFETIEGLEWLYLFVVLIGAAVVHGTLGMGFPMIFTALAAVFIDVKTAVFISLVPSILINIQSLTKGYGWREMIRRFGLLGMLASLGSAIGTKILLVAPPDPIKLVLVISIVFYLLLGRLKSQQFHWIRSKPSFATVAFGLLAGVVGGITNAMGPILVIYFLENHYAKDETVQGLNFCFLLGKIVQLVMFLIAGNSIQASEWLWVAGISLLVFAGLFFGTRIRNRFAVETYRSMLKITLGIITLVLLGQIMWG